LHSLPPEPAAIVAFAVAFARSDVSVGVLSTEDELANDTVAVVLSGDIVALDGNVFYNNNILIISTKATAILASQ
jgi:hypothetical protein